MENVRFLQGVKQYFCTKALDVILLIYLLLGFILLPYKYLWKDIILSLCFVGILLYALVEENRITEYMGYFVKFSNKNSLNSCAAWCSLIACFIFLFLVLSINIFSVSTSLYVFSVFSVFVFLGSIFVILELEFENNNKLILIRSMIIACMPIIYLFASSCASSLFLSLSNLNITLTPWVEYFWKGIAFMLLFFMLMQLIIYFAFLTLWAKLSVYRLFIFAGAFIVSTILVVFASKNVEGISYYVLKSTIDFEWRNQIKCGQLNISRSNEKYFGFNTDKYTVFYSNREGKWGFDELKCKKGSDRRDAYSIENVSEYNVPGWLK
ncbi:hypothetical protein KB243_003944 [Escherichia coli]|nr:hypothetical protein [Escherichia coli]HCS5143945.1 hypothetical protein [Escherichia coli]